MEIYLPKGTKLRNDNYTIVDMLGQGGFGITYLAYFGLSKKRAIKEFYINGHSIRGDNNTITPTLTIQPAEYQMLKGKFKQEAIALSKFNHPGIVDIVDIFEENNTVYYVMEFIDGCTLKQKIRNNGPLTEDETIKIGLQLTTILEEVHNNQFLHQDIKPENIMIDKNDRLILIDFGTVKFYKNNDSFTQNSFASKGYSPFEIYSDKGMRGKYTDVYALGATLYFCLTGKAPEDSASRAQEINLIEPKSLVPGLSDHLNNILLRAMAIKPKQRFQEMKEFHNGLKMSFSNYPEDSTMIFNRGNGGFNEQQKVIAVKNPKNYTLPIMVAMIGFVLIIGYVFIMPRADTTAMTDSSTSDTLHEKKPETPIHNDTVYVKTDSAKTKPKPPIIKPPKKTPIPTYSKPTSFNGYINGLADSTIPYKVRKQWKTDALEYFANENVVVYFQEENSKTSFDPKSAKDFVDWLPFKKGVTLKEVDRINNPDGKIKELTVSIN